MTDRKKAPQFKQVDSIHFLEAIQTTLDNGVALNYVTGGSQDIVKIDFIFNAGNFYQKNPLVAASTNQLIKEGTQNYSAYQIAEGIDNYGAFLEVGNTYDTATITLYTLTKHLEKVLPYVKEVVFCPAFSEKELKSYRKNAVERFKINLEKVAFVAHKELTTHLFKGHPYGMAAELKDYENLNIDAIRDFHQTHYNLGSARILVSGKVTEFVLQTLNTYFGQEKVAKTDAKTASTKPLTQGGCVTYTEKPNALQSAIRIGKIFPNKLHPDYYGLQVLATVLGGYFGARLMANIREDKGYTYGIGAGIMSLKQGGYFFISTEVGSAVTQQALAEIYKEIKILCTQKVTEAELDLVKNYLLGQLLKACDGPFNMGAMFENVHEYGLDYRFYNNYISAIKKITPQTLLDLAVQYFKKETFTEVVVGKM